ncbi:MAG TPA: dTDP-glucose 4,6-dehydratase [Terriglobales bacterium]|nr:dTDP-glucose 4,6-dehydratase [Terriglobales bacterium]
MDAVVVTGGAGFIGCHLVRLLLRQTRMRVVVVDALTYAGSLSNLADVSADPRFHFVHANIADHAAMLAVLRQHQPRWVVNLAAESHVDRSIEGPRAFLQTNVDGTFELLDAAKEYWIALAEPARDQFRFLHISTDEVYGSLGPQGSFSESSPFAPSSPYAASKAAADQFVRAYRETYGLPTLITHCSNNYGPYQLPEKLIPLVILNASAGEALPIYGDGMHVRDWLHVEDHCRGMVAVLERGRVGERYNIGANNERTNREMVELICDLLEELTPAEANPSLRARGIRRYRQLETFVAERLGHDRRYAIDATKMREELGWRPQSAFDEGLRRTVAWYLQHKDWCIDMRKRMNAA